MEDLDTGDLVDFSDSRLFFNRELSWLDFNWRVLCQALDERMPLLERARFVAITASNLDEFTRKRVGGLKRQAAAGVTALSPDGRTPTEQLALIRDATHLLHARMTEFFEAELKPLLRSVADVHLCDYSELVDSEKRWLKDRFLTEIFPILTPLAVDPGHPFPFISNQSLSLAVQLRHPVKKTEHFARIKVPTGRGRWMQLPGEKRFIPLEQVIAANVEELFRGMIIDGVYVFRITRNADVARHEEEADDLVEMISEELRERRFAQVVRLEIERNAAPMVVELLCRELDLEQEDVYEVDGMLDLSDCTAIANLDLADHRFEPWEPVVPERMIAQTDDRDLADIFSVIREHDLLVHHPYESFSATTLRLTEAAAEDPRVLAIKQTLYRTSQDSPNVRALVRAAEAGKQVAVLVEVKARFDEQNNMEWGQQLEAAGVHVTYGVVGLKTHCKTTVVMRQEDHGLRVYTHIGTGNYNATTARLYTDFGLFTCDPVVGRDVTNLFHFLTGYSPEQQYERLIVAPRDARRMFVDHIRNEIRQHEETGHGLIMAKMNAMDDLEIIRELYRASAAGVKIELVVRGHCRLRPGIPGVSENIRVVSILGRFLEHSRVFYFHNGGSPHVFISSADWQRRNLDDRVEAAVQVLDSEARQRLIDVLILAIEDHRQAWDLGSDGIYRLRTPRSDAERRGYQERLMQMARLNQATVLS
ncbi:MAG: polyphosphate kinase 1 [Bacteroidetes bacterium]|nr:polyphosphate kinase 1 [Bacteroidota bacterium]